MNKPPITARQLQKERLSAHRELRAADALKESAWAALEATPEAQALRARRPELYALGCAPASTAYLNTPEYATYQAALDASITARYRWLDYEMAIQKARRILETRDVRFSQSLRCEICGEPLRYAVALESSANGKPSGWRQKHALHCDNVQCPMFGISQPRSERYGRRPLTHPADED